MEINSPIYNGIQNSSHLRSFNMNDDVNWIDISGDWDNCQKHSLTFIDLFSGAGGISSGFEMAGYKGIYGLDNYDAAVKTYSKNFDHPIFNGDILQKKVKQNFISHVHESLNGKKVNVVAGGFPCQGFSLAGNRVVTDPRNSLYVDMLEIVDELKPDFVVMENVVGLRSMLGGKVELSIINDYERKGYEVNVTTLNSADYHVPQKRKRVIFIANRIGAINHHPAPLLQEKEYRTIRYAIEDLMHQEENVKFNHVFTKHSGEMKKRIGAVKEGSSLYPNYSDSWKKSPWDRPSSTIKENHGGVNLHPRISRTLTAREMARIQSFPDHFIFEGSKSKQLVQIGNAVPPLMAKAIGLAIRKTHDQKYQ